MSTRVFGRIIFVYSKVDLFVLTGREILDTKEKPMSKNLTFKLVMEADSKSFISNVKQSEKTLNDAFKAIKDGKPSANFVVLSGTILAICSAALALASDALSAVTL